MRDAVDQILLTNQSALLRSDVARVHLITECRHTGKINNQSKTNFQANFCQLVSLEPRYHQVLKRKFQIGWTKISVRPRTVYVFLQSLIRAQRVSPSSECKFEIGWTKTSVQPCALCVFRHIRNILHGMSKNYGYMCPI